VRESPDAALTSPSAERTQALGEALGRALVEVSDAPVIVAIEGELGAGKTTLVQGVMRALGVTGVVRSPTYTLIEPYTRGERSIYHIDLYRIADPREIEPLGIRDLLVRDAILLIEWPSRAAGSLPLPDVSIAIDYVGASARRIALQAGTGHGNRLLGATLPVPPQ
jgi:tRNA threonylcarbamoyladenosine biosynthesis protein TsaE